MKILNIFTIEKLIFSNQKAKKVLWKEFSTFFKEYIFLKQSSIDTSLMNKFYTKFIEKFLKTDYESYLENIFYPEKIQFNYNIKTSVKNIQLQLDDNFFIIHNTLKQYPNISLTRQRNTIGITFWR